MAKTTWDKIRKFRTASTAEVVGLKLADIDEKQLISDLFVTSNDTFSSQMIKLFEKQLVLAKINPDKFAEQLFVFFVETAKWIGEKKLYKRFFEFVTFIYLWSDENNLDKQIKWAYMDLLMEQASYFVEQKFIYGIYDTGELMITDELYPFIDFALYEFVSKNQLDNLKMMKKSFQKYGYQVADWVKLHQLTINDGMICNELFQLTYFIGEGTLDMYPYPYYKPARGVESLPRIWKPTEYYNNLVQNRIYSLPFKGVVAKLKNAGSIKEILFKERVVSDRLVLLYKVKLADSLIRENNNTYLTGFYDFGSSIGYTYWRESSASEIHYQLENFVLEVYSHLTCDINIDKKKAESLLVTRDFKVTHYVNQPMVCFMIETDNDSSKRENSLVRFNREDFQGILVKIKPFVRRLPEGQTASLEAIENAKKVGYTLREGETFVKSFKKTVYKKQG